jgi:hypothetical protein
MMDSGPDEVRESEIFPGGGHGTLEDARREILRLACLNSAAIPQAVVGDALQGKCLSAKFLFETVGPFAIDAGELENPERHESLASLLLQQWELAPQGGEITEVPEVTPGVAPAHEAPVEL